MTTEEKIKNFVRAYPDHFYGCSILMEYLCSYRIDYHKEPEKLRALEESIVTVLGYMKSIAECSDDSKASLYIKGSQALVNLLRETAEGNIKITGSLKTPKGIVNFKQPTVQKSQPIVPVTMQKQERNLKLN